MIALKNGVLITMEGEDVPRGTILIDEDGMIQAVGADVEIPEEAEVIDLGGKFVMPGLIDVHSHVGISQDLQSLEAELEFMEDYIMPELRTIDAVNPAVAGFRQAREAGFTTIAVSPASTYVVGGQVAVLKSFGKTVDSMIKKEPAALKMALGEMFFYRGIHRKPTPQARMIVAARLREAFVQAENYAREDESLDLGMDIIMQAVDGRLPIFVHAHRATDIMTALRLAKEFSLRLVLVHATEAENVFEDLVDYETPIIASPATFGNLDDWDNIDWEGFARLERCGLEVAICSDHPYMSVEQLRPAVIRAHQAGLSRTAALKSLTLTAATILGMEDDLGSLAEDKDADFIILDGDPLLPESRILEVWSKGQRIISDPEDIAEEQPE